MEEPSIHPFCSTVDILRKAGGAEAKKLSSILRPTSSSSEEASETDVDGEVDHLHLRFVLLFTTCP